MLIPYTTVLRDPSFKLVKSPMLLLKKSLLLICAILCIASAQLFAQATQLPETPAGKIAAAYLAAFNSGSFQSMNAFQQAYFATATLQRRTEAERKQMYERIFGDLGKLQLQRVTEATPQALTLQTRAQNGEVAEFRFEFEPQPPHKILGIRVELLGPEALQEKGVSNAPTTAADFVAQAQAYLAAQTQAEEFSGAVLFARKGKVLLQEAYGFASQEYDYRNRIDTKFSLGSINKIFTAIAIAQLMQQGKLAPQETVGKYLPDYANREVASKVTLQQLLTHRSGLGDFFNENYENTPKDRLRTLQDYLALFVTEPLAFAPGTEERYSNAGYIVLGLIIERVSGQNYFAYVREHIYQPAGMLNTEAYQMDARVPNLATGYTREGSAKPNNERVKNIYTKPGRGSSAGGGYSTLGDLYNFSQALLSNKLLAPKYTEWILSGMESPQPLEPRTTQREGGYGIAGGAPGMNAILEIDFAREHVIIVLSNYDPPSAGKIARKLQAFAQSLKD